MNGQVGWVGLATSLALVAFAAAISLWQRLGLERQVVWAAARALGQLLLVGGASVVMFLILGSVAATTVVVALGLVRLVFTRDHRLLPLGQQPAVADRLPTRRDPTTDWP